MLTLSFIAIGLTLFLMPLAGFVLLIYPYSNDCPETNRIFRVIGLIVLIFGIFCWWKGELYTLFTIF